MTRVFAMATASIGVAFSALAVGAASAETLTIDQVQCAGMSGFRAHWDCPIPVAEDGVRTQVDSVVKDRGQTAVWDGVKPGPLCFDAVHRSLLVRFPGAAEKIAEALAAGKTVEKAELVLPYLDEEIWPQGRVDFPSADGYRYRMNWNCDKLYRERRPGWHAVAHVLRRPWIADSATGPTYNAAVNGAVYWKRFGASDTAADRFPAQLGPAEVSSYHPDGRLDVAAVLTDEAYGGTLGERLRRLSDCGFIIAKWEVYDMRFYEGAYEFANGTGPRAILVRSPQLLVTLKPGSGGKVSLPAAADVPALAAAHAGSPLGSPTAVVPGPEDVARLNERFMARPDWMPEWQYAHVRQLMGLESGGEVKPFYYRVVPGHVIDRARQEGERAAKAEGKAFDADYAVYLAWLDWIHGERPRSWQGHLTGQQTVTWWYNYREAIPPPVRDSILRSWTAWLMPDRETELDPVLRRQYDNTSGKLVHPMVDDPRVGKSRDGKVAEWGQGDTYYRLTGDWRGNKSFYRSGFTREMSTANFNSSASSGALLCGQIIRSERAMADGRAGLMQFPFWLWTHNAGVGQEYIDHYYWAIATAGNKLFADYCEQPEDRMAGWSIITKTVNDLANGYHPNLKRLLGPASRTYYEHVLGVQDGLYHILHVLSPQGALCDVETGHFLELKMPGKPRPLSAWGHDYPPSEVALQSLSGPWADPWFAEMIDGKPLPWYSIVEKKVVADGDWVTTYFGENYGLSSIRLTPQRIHVLGQWRRRPELPASMRDIGTLDLRMGFNQTRIAEDGAGVISEQGRYRTCQHRNKLLMLARPNAEYLASQKAITSLQCTAALFNYEGFGGAGPTWSVFVDDRRIDALPATAAFGQVILVHDGVSYLAIRPLPSTDLGRDSEIRLEPGIPQEPAHHGETNIQPALLIHAFLYRRDAVIPEETAGRFATARTGFAVEMGDEKEYGSFDAFREHIRKTELKEENASFVYSSGGDTLVADWDTFTVNGRDPCADARQRQLWQDTPLSQMGRGRLEKHGAVIERGRRHPELNLFLQAFPKQGIYVATNLLPNYLDYRFSEPGGVKIRADGACSMGRWAVKGSQEIGIRYHAFGGAYAPKDTVEAATVLFITGTKAKPQVTLNGQDVTAALKPWTQDGDSGWLVPLAGTPLPDDQLAARLATARRETTPTERGAEAAAP
ncbi:MAG: hypothetical protein BWZ02_01084 [Lentisphaerae bacterium ADurb.BinA184]|nr:MAG: hypothetical protein BWZ02_01084 [Lentisphaerae bacterium ADurb.BinA184]